MKRFKCLLAMLVMLWSLLGLDRPETARSLSGYQAEAPLTSAVPRSDS